MMTLKMGERDSSEEIAKAFRLFDDDDTGKITLKNLKRVAKELGENMTDDELQVSSLVDQTSIVCSHRLEMTVIKSCCSFMMPAGKMCIIKLRCA